ncbi:MAG: Lrp/AsnC family transcriptional regulator, partial [Nanoarchaeota archaeon]
MLDLKDRKILAELDLDARILQATLAKKVRLSKQVVGYRIQRLEKKDIIQGYYALIDLARLGTTIHVVYLKLTGIPSAQEDAWMEEIDAHPDVLGVARTIGTWDMTIALQSSSASHLYSLLKDITAKKHSHIAAQRITSELDSTYFNLRMLHDIGIRSLRTSKGHTSIDQTDQKIIHTLSHDCRTSLVKMSQDIDMTANAIKHRIQNLEKRGIILGYRTKINYEKLGYLHFRVFLRLQRPDFYDNIVSYLQRKKNIESVSRYIGYADVDFRCRVRTITQLYALIADLKDTFLKDIMDIESLPIFHWKKMRY